MLKIKYDINQQDFKELTSILSNLNNFHSLEVVDRGLAAKGLIIIIDCHLHEYTFLLRLWVNLNFRYEYSVFLLFQPTYDQANNNPM